MLRRILAVMAKDFRTGRRESLIAYVVLSPLALAFGARLLLPLLEDPAVTFALAADLDPAVVARFEEHGTVKVMPSGEAVKERVLRIDDVPGVLAGADGRPVVVLEGNEQAWVKALPSALLDGTVAEAVSAPAPTEGPSRLRTIVAALLAFSVLLMGGVVIGLVVVEEKEQKTLRAFATSPLRFGEYLAAKTSSAVVLGVVLGSASALILLSGEAPLVPLVVASVGALPAALLLGFVLAAFAEGQVGAIAILKGLLFFFVSVPVLGFFVAAPVTYVLFPLTNHWAIQGLHVAVQPGGQVPWREIGLSWLTGGPLVLAAVFVMRRRLGFVTAPTVVGR